MQLRKATRSKAKIRLGLSAVSGAGKTYTALLIAYGLTGDWSKIAVIDTENGSADLYSHLGEFNTLPLEAPYTPERYIEAITACEKGGVEVVIIDSITHEWDGKGGCLEIMDKLGGKYQDWAKVTPRHQAFIEKILSSKLHIITTVRRKQDYEMTKVDGKVKVEKAGLKEITREGFEYELTANLELNLNHYARAMKDRTGLFADKPEFIPGVETGRLIKQWCENGADVIVEEKPEQGQTTAYNHVTIGTAELPLIPNKTFKSAMDKISAMEDAEQRKSAFASVTSKYSLEPQQRKFMELAVRGSEVMGIESGTAK